MPLIDVFLACHAAVRQGKLITRASNRDKEFHFQDWFQARLDECKLNFDEPGRNTYPDFRLVDFASGFEVKGLAMPGRVANYDCNSQVPSGKHRGRRVFYVFGRYPKAGKESFPVLDLVICDGDFLNADSDYVHKNGNIKGFGSYGDIMIRDRKMYVAPTPFHLAQGTEGQITLIAKADEVNDPRLRLVGSFDRVEAPQSVSAYTFDLKTNLLEASLEPNESKGVAHSFAAFRAASDPGPDVSMTAGNVALDLEDATELDDEDCS